MPSGTRASVKGVRVPSSVDVEVDSDQEQRPQQLGTPLAWTLPKAFPPEGDRNRLVRALRWVGRGLPSRLGDQAGAAAVGDKAEQPANEDEDAVLEADEVPEMHDQPGDPGDEAAELESLDVGDRCCSADRRQVAFVSVAERARLAGAQPSTHDLRGVAALLHGDRP